MTVTTPFGELAVVDEPAYTFGSADNVRRYPVENRLCRERRPVSVHGLLLNGEPLAVFGAAAGATYVHEHSALWLKNQLFLAICDLIVCVVLDPVQVRWQLRADLTTCFGIYFHQKSNSLLSHGELSIARFTEDGAIVWQSDGRDIFTGAFSLGDEYVLARDFNDHPYRLRYEDGRLVA